MAQDCFPFAKSKQCSIDNKQQNKIYFNSEIAMVECMIGWLSDKKNSRAIAALKITATTGSTPNKQTGHEK
jgi:hypothetical protein